MEGSTGPGLHPGLLQTLADVPEATSEHSSEGTGTEHGHPDTQRASCFVHVWDMLP